MSDDFQAQPPPADSCPTQTLRAYERFEQVSLRRPYSEGVEAIGKFIDVGLCTLCFLLGLAFVVASVCVLYNALVA
jgi:hypothetical protein